MSDYWIYKQFGRVIGQKESKARLALITASWYEKPFLKFIIWKERVKRYLTADIRLPGDNPFECLSFLGAILIIIFFTILILVILFKISF